MYLSVLRTTSWKSGRKVRQDVTRSFGTFPSYGAVYTGMRQLEAKGFVESRERVLTDRLVREFRLTQSGLDRKNGARGARADDPKTTIQTA